MGISQHNFEPVSASKPCSRSKYPKQVKLSAVQFPHCVAERLLTISSPQNPAPHSKLFSKEKSHLANPSTE